MNKMRKIKQKFKKRGNGVFKEGVGEYCDKVSLGPFRD